MPMWSPWRGCIKCSEGCRFCYIHKGDEKRGAATEEIIKTREFYAPVERTKAGGYKMKAGKVYVCFQSDFLIEQADIWRSDCWEMMRERSDCGFIFLTKRIERLESCLPPDWSEGYPNVTVGCSVENQEAVNARLPVLAKLPIKHRNIILQPLIGEVNIEQYLPCSELVVVGGEYGKNARPLHFDWVLNIREQCVNAKVAFEFRQAATHFIKDGKAYTLNYNQLSAQAKAAGLNYKP